MELYKYKDLPVLQSRQIRLLTVHPLSKDPESIVTCTLTTHDLNNASAKPTFFALSYTWGPPYREDQEVHVSREKPRQIICNEQIKEVSENLYEFLQHWALGQNQTLQGLAWIDAISINQGNISERSQQVLLMGDIYKAASRVVVWLGRDDSTTKSAFDLMNGLRSLSLEEKIALSSYEVEAEHANALQDIDHWKALANLFQRAWFNRAWIIQEVVFATSAIVLCGNHSISWDILVEISHFITTTHWSNFLQDIASSGATQSALPSMHKVPASLAAAQRTWKSPHHEGLLYALIRARPSECKDPRDKVYSQLGLGEASILPDYGMPINEVYIRTARYILEHSGSLLLLTCVEGKEFQTIENLPSWAPDWSVTKYLGLRVTGYRHFSAAGTRPQRFTLSMDGDKHILSIEATKLDDIVDICEAKKELRESLHCSVFWDVVSKLPTTAANGQSRGEVIWRTLMTNRGRDLQTEKIVYPAASDLVELSFRDWVLWRFAKTPDSQAFFPAPSSIDSTLPTNEEIREARTQHLKDPGFVSNLARRASIFDLHYSHSMCLRPFRTKQGYFGLGTQSLQNNDSVWIVPGCRVPLLFRQIEGSERFQLVGGAYVHGVMDGEYLSRDDIRFTMVDLE